MHRWFRFCGKIALLSGLAALSPLPPQAALAQAEAPADPAQAPTAGEASNAQEPPSAIPEPTPGKHQLKVTPLQTVQHQVDVLTQKLDTQGALLATLTQQVEEQKKIVDSLKEENETLTTTIALLEGQVSNLSDSLEEIEAAAESRPAVTVSPPRSTQETGEPTAEHAAPQQESDETPLPPASGSTHIVSRGDNLISIARKHGTTVNDLMKLNRIQDERKLQIGQRLMIPATRSSSPE